MGCGIKVCSEELVEKVRRTVAYDPGHLDLLVRVYESENYQTISEQHEVIVNLKPLRRVICKENKQPIGRWSDMDATDDEIRKAAKWGYNLKGSQFVVIDTDNEEARDALVSKFPTIDDTLKTINFNKKGSCHYWLVTTHKLPRKQFGGYDLLGNAGNSCVCESGRTYMLGNEHMDNIDVALEGCDLLKSIYEVFGTHDPAEIIDKLKGVLSRTV